jgi:uncharacterized repeat protein (TIGR03803 family)
MGNNGETVVHEFAGSDGFLPHGRLVLDAEGNIYGIAYTGGIGSCFRHYGCGVVFKVDKNRNETTLYPFTGGQDDGGLPTGGLISDTEGNLYGATDEVGGAHGYGTVFKVSKSGHLTVLYSFKGGGDAGGLPSQLIFDAKGDLYGTTQTGGTYGHGAVFKLTPNGKKWTETVYSFDGGNGRAPNQESSLIWDAKGNLYGTTFLGGKNDACGTVFKMTPRGKISTFYPFTCGADGGNPAAGLISDRKGNFYGVAMYYGTHYGFGTVFKLSPKGKETTLYTFKGGYYDGAYPTGTLTSDKQGNLYGTTQWGGSAHNGYSGDGVVFKLTPGSNDHN